MEQNNIIIARQILILHSLEILTEMLLKRILIN